MFLKRKSKKPLKEALDLIHQASEIIMTHKRDNKFIPTNEDIKIFGRIEQEFHTGLTNASYILRCMEQRLAGEAEGVRKYTDPEVGKYYNLE